MSRIPSATELDALLPKDLKIIATRLGIKFRKNSRGATLRKRILEAKNNKNESNTNNKKTKSNNKNKNKNKKNKQTQRKQIRKKRKRVEINDDDEICSEDEQTNKRRRLHTSSDDGNNNNNTNTNTNTVNRVGIPNKPFWPKVDFSQRKKRSVDIDVRFLQKWSILNLHYRNQTFKAIVASMNVGGAGFSTYNRKMILGDIILRWTDKDCITDDNPRGNCEALFEVMQDRTLQGFDFITFITGSSAYIEYKLTLAKNTANGGDIFTKSAKKGANVTPLDPTQKNTVENGLSLIDELICNDGVSKDECKILIGHKNTFQSMISKESFVFSEFESVVNQLNALALRVGVSDTKFTPIKPKLCASTTNVTILSNDGQSNIKSDSPDPSKPKQSKKKKQNNIVCVYCLKKFASGTEINHHTTLCHSEQDNVFKCDLDNCNKCCQSAELLKSHQKKKHFKRIPINHKCCNIKNNAKCTGDLSKARFWSGSRTWKNWGCANDDKYKGVDYGFCVRCSKCGIIWKFVEDWDYTNKGNPTGKQKIVKKK